METPLSDKIDESLTIHLEEMDFSDLPKDADYHARLIRTIVLGVIEKHNKFERDVENK